ncbi:SDR family oxidoreductase [Roseimaritima sediminicola]|uniref:SDR family oxidoreductase n=1 Tax=Roseimaritima sediminicola TaxID=2662066 RepID=UPI001F4132CC|nr:SDR family NAD(P)-dependent oxidoreductase [Roseimaritima sediminicola]
MKIQLDDKVIVITGGSEGIGAEIAKTCAACGARVGILSRDQDEMQSVVDAIKAQGGQAMWAEADVTEDDQVKQAVEQVAAQWGRIDGLVANAGTNGTWAPIDELSPEDWRMTLDVNLTGTFFAIRHAAPHLKKQGGSIVVMSSINGTRTFSNSGASAYAASKAGQFALAKMLALELAQDKVRVNVICPGAIESAIHEKTEREDLDSIRTPVEYPEGQIPLIDGAMGDPQQVANLTAFLLGDLSAHITGTPVWIDGGQSLIR